MDHGGRTQLVVRGLGRAEIAIGSLTLVPDAGMLFPLALVLAQRAGDRIPRATLREVIWPSASEKAGRHSLRQALYRLHAAGLVSDDRDDEIRVDPTRVDSDVSRVLLPGWPESADPRIIESAATVLPGFAPLGGSALEEFTEQLRARVAAQHRRALLHRIAAARREGRWRELEHWALLCLQADPLNEEATLARAEAAGMVGAKNEALEILDTHLRELGDRAKVIGLPARLLRRRISELTDTTGRRVTATSAPFVGRHDVLGTAQDTLAEARGGSAAALWLVGPAGIGKSRLLREIERASKMAGWAVIAGGARPSFEDRPFALLTDVLPGLLDAPGALGAAPHALSLMRQMGTVNSDEEPLEPEEARSRQHAVYHSWVDLMDAVLAETPLALLLDDVQWSDPLTLLMLARFMESRPKARLAVILSTRGVPTRDDAAAARLLSAAEFRVGPLSDDEIRDFAVGAGLARDARFDDVARHLGRASGGSPLFLSHLVHQHLWHPDLTDTPSDLASLIDIQLRGLSKEATRLLQACALLGQHATLPRIERSLGVQAPALVSAFGELDDMLALPTDPGVPLAPHDLWTERVRRGMTSGVFRSLAVSVARVLEADAVADGGIELYWDAARRYQESGEKQLAFATMMRCAEYLMRTGATSEASRAYLAASELAVTGEGATNAFMGRVRTLQAMGEWEEVLKTLVARRSYQQDADDALGQGENHVIELEARWHSMTPQSHIAHLTGLVNDESLAPADRLRGSLLGAIVADNQYDATEVRSFAAAGSRVPHFTDDEFDRLRLAVLSETAVGSLSKAMQEANSLLLLVRRQNNAARLSLCLRFASYPFRRAGEYDTARSLLSESKKLADFHHFASAQFRACDLLAGLAIDYERYDEARVALEMAQLAFSESVGGFNLDSLNASWALCFIGQGQWSDARCKTSEFLSLDLSRLSRNIVLPAAASLRVLINDGETSRAAEILDTILAHGDRPFRHSGVDQVAIAVAIGLEALDSLNAAQSFSRRFLREQRRDLHSPPELLRAFAH